MKKVEPLAIHIHSSETSTALPARLIDCRKSWYERAVLASSVAPKYSNKCKTATVSTESRLIATY